MRTSSLLIFSALAASFAAAPCVADAQSSPWSKQPSMPSTMYVRGGSAPIDQALATIVPAPYQIALDGSIPKSTMLVWADGSNWMDVLRSAVAPLGLSVEPDWAHNTIRIVRPSRPSQRASTDVRRAVMPATSSGRSSLAQYFQGTPPASHHTQAVPVGVPKPPSTSAPPPPPAGAKPAPKTLGYTLKAGTRLSEGLAKYVARFGWHLRWKVNEDYMLDTPVPIPLGTLQNGMLYIMHTYQSQGGLMNAVVVFAQPNKTVVVKPAEAQESH